MAGPPLETTGIGLPGSHVSDITVISLLSPLSKPSGSWFPAQFNQKVVGNGSV